jgi:hypothetical protein
MDNFIQVPLNLPNVLVLSTHRTEQGYWLIRVESTLEGHTHEANGVTHCIDEHNSSLLPVVGWHGVLVLTRERGDGHG